MRGNKKKRRNKYRGWNDRLNFKDYTLLNKLSAFLAMYMSMKFWFK